MTAQDGPGQVLEAFLAGFNATDPVALARLFRADATFFGSTEPALLHGPEGAQGYFTRAWPPGSRRAIACLDSAVRVVAPDAAMMRATCRVEAKRPDGSVGQSTLRLMGLVLRDAQGWRFADLHASAAPPPRP